MDLEDLIKTAKELGFGAGPDSGGDRARLEVPAGSGLLLSGRPARDGLAFAILGGLEVSETHLAGFEAATANEREAAFADLVSYLCLFDVEYQFDADGEVPRSLHVGTRWDPETGATGLLDSVKLLLRAKEGCAYRIRHWAARLSAAPADTVSP